MAATATEDEADEAAVAPSGARSVGRVIADTYRLVRFLAAGGSGDVYEAEHLRLGRGFAVKLLRSEPGRPDSIARRFRREARAIAKVHSEFVVSIVDCGTLDDHTPYLVMELLRGEDLRALLDREGALPVRRALQIAIEACTGLADVHAAGLVHRDIKPENLFITRRASGADWCKLLDFGVAKIEASQVTAHGAILGTVRYMAPEQLADGARVSSATDVHALGAVLFECLSGRPAYVGETTQELMYRIMNEPPPSLRELRPELPAGLASLVQRCLAKSAAERPASAPDLLQLLRRQLESSAPSEVEDVTIAEGPTKGSRALMASPPRRSRVPSWWGLPVAAAAIVASFAYVLSISQSRPKPGSAAAPPAPATGSGRAVASASLAEVSPRVSPTVAPAIPSDAAPAAPLSRAVSAPTIAQRPRPRPRAVPPQIPTSETRARSVREFDRINPYGE